MNFTSRQIKILRYVMERPQGVLRSELAEFFNLSLRTIRLDISNINQTYEFPLIVLDRKKGYLIIPHRHNLVTELLDNHVIIPDESSVRGLKILSKLIKQKKVKIYDLVDELYLSESSIRKEIIKLNELSHQEVFDVKNEEVKWICSELEKRQVVFSFIQAIVFQRQQDDLMQVKLKILFDDFFFGQNWNDINSVIIHIIKTLEYSMQEQEVKFLSSCILACEQLNHSQGVYQIENQECNFHDANFINLLKLEFPSLSNCDLQLLSGIISTFRTVSQEKAEISPLAELVFDTFCNEVFDKFSIDLRDSRLMGNKLQVHIEYMCRRIDNHLELRNPLKTEIKSKYLYAYEISTLIVPIIYRYKQVYLVDDELSFLAIYLEHFLNTDNKKIKTLLVNDSRSSIAEIFHDWTELYFRNQIEIVDTVLLDQYNESNYPTVELIIGMCEMPQTEKIIYRFVSLPDERDIARFYEVIHSIKYKHRLQNVIKEVCSKKRIYHFKKSVTLKDVITEMSHNLKTQGIIDCEDEFIKDVLNREHYYPSYITPQILIPHPLNTFSNENSISIAILKQPIGTVRVVFLIAIMKNRTEEVNDIFEFFKILGKDNELIKSLIDSSDSTEVLSLLNSIQLKHY